MASLLAQHMAEQQMGAPSGPSGPPSSPAAPLGAPPSPPPAGAPMGAGAPPQPAGADPMGPPPATPAPLDMGPNAGQGLSEKTPLNDQLYDGQPLSRLLKKLLIEREQARAAATIQYQAGLLQQNEELK